MSIEVRTTPQAQAQINKANRWWKTHRDETELFKRELASVFERIANKPDSGRPVPRRYEPHLRRMLMPKTQHHVYYVHEPQSRTAFVVAVWGARRKRGPSLGRR